MWINSNEYTHRKVVNNYSMEMKELVKKKSQKMIANIPEDETYTIKIPTTSITTNEKRNIKLQEESANKFLKI